MQEIRMRPIENGHRVEIFSTSPVEVLERCRLADAHDTLVTWRNRENAARLDFRPAPAKRRRKVQA